ncbi:MAG: UDP-N-acetylmuramoyl-L-alanyl-D-glutamate--2,6-diaminopimelate ligase [Candidatus Delongbacteria bacterium]|nr:UDP-N-acetylmuramoyl-L-alanyl-D-glutamate--2,6-diaminopimelate ligase [Candidatus Delongbacteria bacterium]MBN2836836.1 UDP-N-acetylmuramoyl-L-alanyl-D-glutamate--2,6-diaminopimelate ligase [Candidatus Delongbacteria bacterium]
MRLQKILDKIKYSDIVNFEDKEIFGASNNSSQIQENFIFFAVKGSTFDGIRFIDDAVKNGSRVVFHESDIQNFVNNVTYVRVPNLRSFETTVSSEIFDNPQKKLKFIGITGTNGKTSTAYIIWKALNKSGRKCGLIGTVLYHDGKKEFTPTHTTPDSFVLNKYFSSMVDNGCEFCVMEVSSHSLVMNRVDHIKFDISLFTNLTQDHLDFHKSMEEYGKAKSILFDSLTKDNGSIVYDCKSSNLNLVISEDKSNHFIINRDEFLKIENYKQTRNGIEITFSGKLNFTLKSNLFGLFQVNNISLGVSVLYLLNYSEKEIASLVNTTTSIPGRMEKCDLNNPLVFIDYAHTPDALDKLLNSVKDIPHGKIISVFGCGGNRDRLKRPLMGKIASENSDITIITSDNPRNENPEEIIDEIFTGISNNFETIRESDRKKAIQLAIKLARPDDLIVIAGKGHENYQEIKGVKYPFSDKEIVEELCLK